MKLETLKQVLNEMPPPPRTNGNVTSYGLILRNPSSYRIDYDEVENILVFTDKSKFQAHIAKLFPNSLAMTTTCSSALRKFVITSSLMISTVILGFGIYLDKFKSMSLRISLRLNANPSAL